jgi:hypothetical protein
MGLRGNSYLSGGKAVNNSRFGALISDSITEVFIARGDIATARERLEYLKRRHGADGGDYRRLAEAIIAISSGRPSHT